MWITQSNVKTLHDVYTPDFCIKFQLSKRFFFKKKKKKKIRDILVFFVFLMAKINEMVLIENNLKFRGSK